MGELRQRAGKMMVMVYASLAVAMVLLACVSVLAYRYLRGALARINARLESLSANAILAKESNFRAHSKINTLNQRIDNIQKAEKKRYNKNNGNKTNIQS